MMRAGRGACDSGPVWNSGPGWPVVSAALGVATITLGLALARARRAFARALQERGWLLERERESAASAAVDAERARIARELHDIVSHNVSLMVVQAGAARQVLTTHPEDARGALVAVERAGRDTMTELRHLLGVLAPTGTGEPAATEGAGRFPGTDPLDASGLSPQPSLSRLSPLLDRIAFAGLPVEMRISGEPRPLPAGVDVTAYRIVQEALTNALRHGDAEKAEVTVRYSDRYLRVEVLNGGPSVLIEPSRALGPRAPGPGRGLIGLRERVAVLGGDLDARRRLGGGFRVRARIPLDRP
jgi:signal transduction histidine kinase